MSKNRRHPDLQLVQAYGARAGRMRPHPRADGTLEYLDRGGGPPLGVLENLNLPAETMTLLPGDLLVLYTDGIPEAFSPHDKLMGMDLLYQAIHQGQGDPQRTRDAVLETVNQHAAGRPRVDDQTLVVMGYGEA